MGKREDIVCRLLPAVALCCLMLMACGQSQKRYDRILTDAGRCLETCMTDSAVTILESIDVADLGHDSLRAKYAYIMALAHLRQNRSMIGDSLIGMAHKYYSGKDKVRDMRSGALTAFYKFWVGDTPGAVAMLDSLTSLESVPDSLMVEALRMRVLLGASRYEGESNVRPAKRLARMETDPLRRVEAKYMMVAAYEYAGHLDSALEIIDSLLVFASENGDGRLHFEFTLERVQLLLGLKRYAESNEMADYILEHAPGNDATYVIYLLKAYNHFNMGDYAGAINYLAEADSISTNLSFEEDNYYQNFSRLMQAVLEYRETGHLSPTHIAQNTNRQKERFNRMQASQWESERSALKSESRALALKAENRNKTIIIMVIVFVSVIVSGSLVWITKIRRRRQLESEERAEALQKMVDEFKSVPAVAEPDNETLRRAMLQQLGIVKMVAETPTEQNREMLRRISSIGAEIGDNLVNWHNLYDVIDNLYSGFYTRLRERYGELLTEKETQIIVLMAAGFSTKEMSVITSQTTATIYVRKSAIRRKLGIAEKEDTMAFLRREPAG